MPLFLVVFAQIGIVPERNDHDATDLDMLDATLMWPAPMMHVLADWLTSIAGVIFMQFCLGED